MHLEMDMTLSIPAPFSPFGFHFAQPVRIGIHVLQTPVAENAIVQYDVPVLEPNKLIPLLR